MAQSCAEVTPAMRASGAAKLALFTHKQLIRPKPPLKTRGEDGYDHRIICFCVSDIGLVILTVENPHPQQQHGFKNELHKRKKEKKRERENANPSKTKHSCGILMTILTFILA